MNRLNFSLQFKYLVIAILIIGSMGVWLPFILAELLQKKGPIEMLPISITTFFVSIYFAGCVENILNKIENLENKHQVKSNVFNMIALILLFFFLIIAIVWLTLVKNYIPAYILTSIGTIISLLLWWNNNKNNATFNDIVRQQQRAKHGKGWKNYGK